MALAFVDESGDRGLSRRASPHFVMAGCVFADHDQPKVHLLLEQLRVDLGRPSNSYLSWKNFRSHSQRLHTVKVIAQQEWLTALASISCKRFLPGTSMNESQLYLYSFRFLLERLSWLGRDKMGPVDYTLAHILRFKLPELRNYEQVLRSIQTNIDWNSIRGPGKIDQPNRVEELQLADLIASAVGAAFNPDEFGNVETRYVHELRPRLYRYKPTSPLTSYGLKMHPWNDATRTAYQWLTVL